MTKKTNVVPMRRRSSFATAADTFDVDALIRELDGQGANSTSYRQSVAVPGDVAVFGSGSGRRRAAA